MAPDLDTKPDDDKLNPAKKAELSSLNGSLSADNSGYDPKNPASKAKKPLGTLEDASLADGNKSATNTGESGLLSKAGDTVGKGYSATPATGLSKITSGITRKRAAAGGGIAAMITTMIMVGIGSSSLYLVNIKEGLTGEGNEVNNTIGTYMQRRRINSFSKVIQKNAQLFQTDKLITKLSDAGFDVKASRGAIKSISKEGVELVFDGTNKTLAKDIARLGESASGRNFLKSFDNVAKESVSRFAGTTTRKSVLRRLGISAFIDWIGAYRVRAGPDIDGKNQRVIFSDALNKSDEVIDDFINNLDDAAAKSLAGADETVEAINIGDDISKQADDLKVQTNDAGGERVVLGSENQLDEVIGASDNVAQSLTNNADEAAQSLAGRLGGKLGGAIVTSLASGVDFSSAWRQGCRARGTLEFVKNVRNTLMAIELAKFAVKFYTVADHQKAGLIQSSSLKLMALYLAGSTGSGGMQWALTGGKAVVSAEGISRYGVGYADVGILAGISTFLSSVPGLGPNQCKFVNNPITQGVGTVAGGFVSLFTFGGATAVNAGFSVGVTVANELAFAIATPLLVRTAAGIVIDGWEDSFQAGDALASGDGVYKTMTAGANGGLPVTNEAFALQSSEANRNYKETLAEQNVFDRYFNIAKSNSLASKLSLKVPHRVQDTGGYMRSFATSSHTSFASSVLNSLNPFKGTAQAIGSNQCQDSAVLEYDIATDPFCNPILSYAPVLDLDQTEEVLRENSLINIAGEPVGEFEEFIENCFSGRTGILHPVSVSQDGETNPIDDTCVVGRNDTQLAGDVPEYFAAVGADDRGWLEKLLTPGAYAQSSVDRIPTKKERFAAWYGYIVDQENMSSQINDDLANIGIDDSKQVNSNVFTIGDSLTVGMQNLAGTDQEGGNYLERELRSSGWNPTINAQGCRSVYQTAGAIDGDGESCPDEQIIDALSVVNAPENLRAIKSAGTFVIALGTNAGEKSPSGSTDNSLFKTKSEELIDKIREFNPAAKIYWLNLRFKNDSDNRQEARNDIINELVAEKRISLMDWSTYVTTLSDDSDFTNDVVFADDVHHDARSYKIKADYVADSLGQPSANINDTTVVEGEDTSNIPCGAGVDRGEADGYQKGAKYNIRICDVQGTIVNSQISINVDRLFTESRAAGANLSGGGFRTMEAQQSAWRSRCGNLPYSSRWSSPPCSGARLARPGYSNHQMGLAIDFNCDGALIGSTENKCFKWLENNAREYGLFEWGNDEQEAISPTRGRNGYEPWHWSYNGN